MNAVRYVTKRWISEWDADEEYTAGDVTEDPTTGTTFICTAAPGSPGVEPNLDRAHWSPWNETNEHGGPTGRRTTIRQNFMSNESITQASVPPESAILRPGRWALDATVTAGNAFLTFQVNAAIDPGQSMAQVQTSTGATDKAALVLSDWPAEFNDRVWASFEFDASMPVVGSNGADYWITIGDGGPSRAFDSDYAAFVKRASDTNWQVRTKDGATASAFVDTGVAPSGDVPQRFRIVYVGANHTTGGTKVLFYIDGQLVATRTTNLPSAGAFIQGSWGVINNGGTAKKLNIGDCIIDVQRTL
jgi:hypothetical protein